MSCVLSELWVSGSTPIAESIFGSFKVVFTFCPVPWALCQQQHNLMSVEKKLKSNNWITRSNMVWSRMINAVTISVRMHLGDKNGFRGRQRQLSIAVNATHYQWWPLMLKESFSRVNALYCAPVRYGALHQKYPSPTLQWLPIYFKIERVLEGKKWKETSFWIECWLPVKKKVWERFDRLTVHHNPDGMVA